MSGMTPQHSFRRWPLFLIAAPAAVAVWSGWVGLGALAGFGVVHPLPGIVPGLRLNTAITLPVGVEAYGAYALGVWLAPFAIPARARTFARRSAIGALLLGMTGQVSYHLLAAAHASRAPWLVVVAVSCMPVVTLGFGVALTHLLRAGEPEAAPAVTPPKTHLEAISSTSPAPPAETAVTPSPAVTSPVAGTPSRVPRKPAAKTPSRDSRPNGRNMSADELAEYAWKELGPDEVPSVNAIMRLVAVGREKAKDAHDILKLTHWAGNGIK